MKIFLFVLSFITLLIHKSSAQIQSEIFEKAPYLEIPLHNSDDVIIYHKGFSLLYNESHEQAQWVAYVLTKEETNNIYHRTNKFLLDPSVKSETANDNDYLGSGYDRGHLAPASDMGWSAQTMYESFFYSNMSPQVPSFNRGIWKKLEEQVRTWAISYDSIYVVTGPVLREGLSFIGKNKVSVPDFYYKVILDLTDPEHKGIGFIMKNEGSGESLSSFAVTIDSVEKFTGINFFPQLADNFENKIEASLCVECWMWKPVKISNEKIKKSVNDHEIIQHSVNDKFINNHEEINHSAQCVGRTQSGQRCKRKTRSSNQRCFQHGGD
jgi:endonuclease G